MMATDTLVSWRPRRSQTTDPYPLTNLEDARVA